jgi:hypothetical protein
MPQGYVGFIDEVSLNFLIVDGSGRRYLAKILAEEAR